MTTELTMLAWTLVLALVQVSLPVLGKTVQYGSKWNAGPRDEPMPPPNKVTGRLDRAQANLFETLPVFIGAVLIAHVAGRESAQTALGAEIFFWARVVYVPVYWAGIAGVRTGIWGVSIAGLAMMVSGLL